MDVQAFLAHSSLVGAALAAETFQRSLLLALPSISRLLDLGPFPHPPRLHKCNVLVLDIDLAWCIPTHNSR